jgi:GNAT superfamily N-acetyltransferase
MENRSEVTFRALAPADADAFAVLLARYGGEMRHAAAPDAPDHAQAAALLAEPRTEILGAFLADALVGFALFYDLPEAISGSRAGQIDDLYVTHAARGHRLAQRLIETVAALGRARGWVQLRWLVPNGNTDAQRAYDRFAAVAPWTSYVIWLGNGDRW